MTIRQALAKYQKIEIDLLLARLLGKSKEFIFLHPEFILSSYHFNILSSLIQRRMRGEPIAYILGYKDFYGLRFKVNQKVLIPRPETELIVDLVSAQLRSIFPLWGKVAGGRMRVDLANQKTLSVPAGHLPQRGRMLRGSPLKILDVGTGSGNIIISLAKELQKWKKVTNVTFFHFYASDVSREALKVARQNSKTILGEYSDTSMYRSEVKFIKSDLLDNIKIHPDIIIANLPYGWSEWKNQSSMETRGLAFEPKQALYTSGKGLYEIGRLLKQIASRKNKPKLIYLEFDPRQKADLGLVIKKTLPEARIKFYKDYAGHWRVAQIAI